MPRDSDGTPHVECAFVAEATGASTDPYTLGNLGGRGLECFTRWFDYPAGRVGFLPRKG